MQTTHELLQAAMPTRHEKRRVARELNYAQESSVYKWAEPLSGVHNPITLLEAVLDHAVVHHPEAALAIVHYLEGIVLRSLRERVETVSPADLVTTLQPQHEKETTESVQAFSRALRQLVLRGKCDLDGLLQEVQEAIQANRKAEIMIQALIEAEKTNGQA